MAHVDRIFVHGSDMALNTITAYVKLKPAGEVALKVELPAGFKGALIDIAQKAADLHEAQMRAEIITENNKEAAA